jgi:hypothetical protein
MTNANVAGSLSTTVKLSAIIALTVASKPVGNLAEQSPKN